jgi:hypothetical protein
LFGIELLGFNLEGEVQTIVSDLPRPPQVDWGGEHAAPHRAPSHSHVRQEKDDGLRIRLGR